MAETKAGAAGRRRSVTRTQVLEVATQVFAGSGYRGANLHLVASELGVTRQALYYHFDSKDEILGALFESLMSRLETAALRPGEPLGPEPRFCTLLRGHVEVILANLTLAGLIISEHRTLDSIDWLGAAERRGDYSELFVAAYREGEAEGLLRPAVMPREAEAILATVNAVCTEPGPSRTGVDAPEVLVELVAGGILGGTGARFRVDLPRRRRASLARSR